MENFHPINGDLGKALLSYNYLFYTFLKEGEISPNRTRPLNRHSPPPYEQPL